MKDSSLPILSALFLQTAFDFTKLTCKQVVTCGGMASPEELDNIAERVGLLSPLVDDLASELPAPIDVDKVCRLVCTI